MPIKEGLPYLILPVAAEKLALEEIKKLIVKYKAFTYIYLLLIKYV